MAFRIPRVYPITDALLSGLSHAEQIRRLIAGGASLIQLREKQLAPREFYREAVIALETARAHQAQLIINDRVDIALAIGADGVHLGQTDCPPEAARKLLGDDAIIGLSTHNIEQARLASTLPLDYLAVGPIFRTSTKRGPDPALGLDGLSRIRAVVENIPVVAIGGINLNNAREVLNAGADSIALIAGLLMESTEITLLMREMLVLAQK